MVIQPEEIVIYMVIWKFNGDVGFSIAMGGTPIAGWFRREHPTKMDD